ncbi:hypothetical protein [Desulforegula conservatrix]|uniref:hypothetical protein n=1 Tax=Desulforegula conservatrix TaxID=153026 RepID=UPI0003FE613D|nr:hypothetical protein [Desulforegula conservatrix]
MLTKLLELNCAAHEGIKTAWGSSFGRRFQGNLLIATFLWSLLLVEAAGHGLVPDSFVKFMPKNHLASINNAFTLLLMFEGIGLAIGFVASVSEAVSKQFEIFSLILIRDAFKEMSHLNEPLTWASVSEIIPSMAALSFSALAIFVMMGFFTRLHIKAPVMRDEHNRRYFIRSKELISMFLLVAFILICTNDMLDYFSAGENETIFHSFFTLLAFTDVLMVLVSLKYGNMYALAFRDSAFAVATVMVRMALMAPPVYSAMIGIASSFFVVCVVMAYNRFALEFLTDEKRGTVNPSAE